MTWDLTVRRMEERDFAVCASMLEGRLAYPNCVIGKLPHAWRRLLRAKAMNAVVFENRNGSEPPVILAFAVSIFVTDAWAAAANRGTEPYLTARTLRAELSDPESPILRPSDITRRLESRLRILILHYCETPTLEPERAGALRFRALQEFLHTNRGYPVEEVIQEFWDEIDPAFILEGWGKVRADYASYFADRGEPVPPPGQRPYLIGFSRAEALREPGDPSAPLFVHTPPILSFSPAEKRLIRQALRGQTDPELARELHIALPTVKSHWRSIYGRALRAAPDLFGDARIRASDRGGTRGREKRRRLLEYVRRHPEELCPIDYRRRLD
jgi:DNA-binding CsgD family transcriptional regulator